MDSNRRITKSEVFVRDYYGVMDGFPVIETGKAPEGYGQEIGHKKVKVVYLNSRNEEEVSVVHHEHIGLSRKRKQEIIDRVNERHLS